MFSSVQCIIWFVLALIAEIPSVVCPFLPLGDNRLIVSWAFEVLNLNGTFLSPLQTRVWTETNSSLGCLTDAWNGVRFIPPLAVLVGG